MIIIVLSQLAREWCPLGHDKHNEIIAAADLLRQEDWMGVESDFDLTNTVSPTRMVTNGAQAEHKSQGKVWDFYQMTMDIILLGAGTDDNLFNMLHR